MDGRLAIIFGLFSLFGEESHDQGFVDWERANINRRFTLSAGAVRSQGDYIGYETRLTYSFDKWRKFNPVIELSVTEDGGAWLGVGVHQQFDIIDTPIFIGFYSLPGFHVQGGDIDLGFPIMFRAGMEIGLKFDSGWQIALAYDHRSNADLSRVNPGMETLQFRLSKSFGRR